MALSPESEVGHFEGGLRRIQIHHSHHPSEEVTGSIQHSTSKQSYPCRVADKKGGGSSLKVEDVHRGQDDHSYCSLEEFEPGHSSKELNVWQGVNHSVLLCGHIRVFNKGCDFGDNRSM